MPVSAGPPLGGLYLKPPSSGGLCDGVMTTPSARPGAAAAVVGQDGVRDDRRRGVAAVRLDHHVHAVGSEHLDRRHQRRLGEGVGVHADEERAGRALARPVLADRLADGQDVILVEAGSATCRDGPRCRRRRVRRLAGSG